MNSLSKLIFKTKPYGIKFDREFILKTMQKKKVSISGAIVLKMKSLSNMILFDFDLKIKFGRDFILKMMQKKK